MDRYLTNSRNFNAEYTLNNEINPYKWYQINYAKDTSDIMRCPAYTINTGTADCDGFAYLSTIQEKYFPFAFFLLIISDEGCHMVALYQESPTTYTIYSNKSRTENQTLEGYLDLYPNVTYICKIDITLHRIKGGSNHEKL